MTARVLAVLIAFTTGCGGASVREVCENLEAQKSCFEEFSFDDCVADASFLEDDARGHGCDEAFDDYLGCVNVTVCTSDKECAVERDVLERCVGDFP